MDVSPTHVLAHRFGCLFLLAGLSGVLPGIRRGLAGAHSNGGILAPATVEAALLPSGDTLTVIQVVLLGLVAASGFWGGFATLGGSRSLGPHGRQFAQGGDEGCGGEKDEVRNSAGPRRRVGVHDRDRGTEATMAPVLREPDGERCRRDWRGSWALRRLQRLPAAWGEGSQKPEVSHLHPLHSGTLGAVEGVLQGVSRCLHDVGHPNDGNMRGFEADIEKFNRLYAGAWHLREGLDQKGWRC